jgi:tRNA U34 5-carboxymethylaminomethyl modifying enzyme MnmG/GidA
MRIQKYTRLHYGYICNNATHYDKPDRCTHRHAYRVETLESRIENEIQSVIEKGCKEGMIRDNTHEFMLSRKARLEKRWENLNNAYLNDTYTLEYFLKMDAQIKREIAEIVIAPQKKIDYVDCWERYKKAETPTDKRNILKEFISSIEITQRKFFINWQQF